MAPGGFGQPWPLCREKGRGPQQGMNPWVLNLPFPPLTSGHKKDFLPLSPASCPNGSFRGESVIWSGKSLDFLLGRAGGLIEAGLYWGTG
ncbi:hypothetical protein AVEN_50414-1 [Araneus ventricosus]|uniref:Uncharacterized protein n=1 Tax=Araneus ventricosus TaxID=182803 RepID=A0A4Y2EUE2_ARAVE|nr:hypothetical protein AVEN_50414-1 [Araneus ventricosus]